MGTTPRKSSQLGEELKDKESPLSSLQKGSDADDQELHRELNKRTGVLQFLLLPLRLIGSLESENGCDLGLFFDDEQVVKIESIKTSGVNSSRLTDRLIPDLIVNMTPLMLGSDFVALFSGCKGFLGVILPEGDSLGVQCGVICCNSTDKLSSLLSNKLPSNLSMFLKVYCS